MMADFEICAAIEEGEIGYEPFDSTLIQPASIDMRLDRYFRFYPSDEYDPIDPFDPERRTVGVEGEKLMVRPQQFMLASTKERITLPANIVGRLEGKSSLARMGLFVHVTAGFFDPGFDGFATLEIFNANPSPIVLHENMTICQMSFMRMAASADRPYGSGRVSKYQHQAQGPQESAYYKNAKPT
jgi:dCTP deaminase